MRYRLRVVLLALCLSCSITPSIGVAGFDEGVTAYKKKDYVTAMREFKPIATQGDSSAQFNVGFMYYNGLGVPQEYKEAIKWFRLSAVQGNTSAQSNLGLIYNSGHGVPPDHKEAAKWLRLAADQGNAISQSYLGEMYGQGIGVPQDYKEAVKLFRLAADQGYSKGQFNLGLMYNTGQGFSQNHPEAMKWYRLAAGQGHALAQSNLGLMYNAGQGVPQDYKEAMKWYRLAAEQGESTAQFNLGLIYANGQGIPQDYKKAVKWFRLAADQGYVIAQNRLGGMYGKGQGVSQDSKEAVKWFRLAADQGDVKAMGNLGVSYEYGDGVASNSVIAYALYSLSAHANRARVAKSMSAKNIEAAQDLTRDLSEPKNFLKALDRHSNKPTINEYSSGQSLATDHSAATQPTPAVFSPSPAAKAPVQVSEGTTCDQPINWQLARQYIGQTVAVAGPLMKITYREDSQGSPTWVDIGAIHPNAQRLTLIIWGDQKSEFPMVRPGQLEGRNVCIVGQINNYKGTPQIELRTAKQFKVLSDESMTDRSQLLLQVAQESRYNDEWLRAMALAYQDRKSTVPMGSLKTQALMLLVEHHYDFVVQNAYGEQKYIDQLAKDLKGIGSSLGTPKSVDDIERFNKTSKIRLNDIHFLNNFLYWYVSPLIAENLSQAQLLSLGWSLDWSILPGNFEVEGLQKLDMKGFTHDDGKPITKYLDFLGLID